MASFGSDWMPRGGVMGMVAYSIIIEGALYSAIAPVVPELRRAFHLTDLYVGLIVAGYSAGVVVGSLASVLVIRRTGARNAAIVGLLAFAVTTTCFAVAPTAEVVVASRLGQGLSSGLLWTACTFWLLSSVAPDRRGETLGTTMSYSMIGTIAGPVLGTVAAGIGVKPTYIAVALVCAAVPGWLVTVPADGAEAVRDLTQTEAVRADSQTRHVALLAIVLIVLAGGVAGLLNTQSPLELEARSMSDVAVGVVFTIAAITTIAAGPVIGTVTDRVGAAVPLTAGLCGAAACLLLLATDIASAGAYAALVLVLMPLIFMVSVPAGALLTVVADRARWSLPFSVALAAAAWGVGETVGAVSSGALLDVWGAVATSTGAAVLVGVSAALTWLAARWSPEFPGLTRPAVERPPAP